MSADVHIGEQIESFVYGLIQQEENDTVDKIVSLLRLEKGWNYGSGLPPSIEVALQAAAITSAFHEAGWKTDAFPGDDGEILIAGSKPGRYAEATVERNLSNTLYSELGGTKEGRLESLGTKEITEKIKVLALGRAFSTETCRITDTLILDSGTLRSSASLERRSKTPWTRTEFTAFPLLERTAAYGRQAQSVRISEYTAQNFPALQSSGELMSRYFPHMMQTISEGKAISFAT